MKQHHTKKLIVKWEEPLAIKPTMIRIVRARQVLGYIRSWRMLEADEDFFYSKENTGILTYEKQNTIVPLNINP